MPEPYPVPSPALSGSCRCPLSQPEKLRVKLTCPGPYASGCCGHQGWLGGTHGRAPRHLWNGVKAGPGAPGAASGGGGHALRQAACGEGPWMGFPSRASASPSVNGRARAHGQLCDSCPWPLLAISAPDPWPSVPPSCYCVLCRPRKGLLLGGTLCEVSNLGSVFLAVGQDRVEQASVCELHFQLP